MQNLRTLSESVKVNNLSFVIKIRRIVDIVYMMFCCCALSYHLHLKAFGFYTTWLICKSLVDMCRLSVTYLIYKQLILTTIEQCLKSSKKYVVPKGDVMTVFYTCKHVYRTFTTWSRVGVLHVRPMLNIYNVFTK